MSTATKTSPWVRLCVVLLGAAALVALCDGGNRSAGGGGSSFVACGKPLDPAVLWLPENKRAFSNHLERQALMLHGRGQCVLDGSWSGERGAFYFTVQEPGGQPRIVRFSVDELMR